MSPRGSGPSPRAARPPWTTPGRGPAALAQEQRAGWGRGRAENPGAAHQFLVAPVVLVALPVQPLRQQLERDTKGVRVTTTAGRPGGTGTRGHGDGDAGAADRPGTAPAPAPAPAADKTRGQTPPAAPLAPGFARPPAHPAGPHSPAPLGDTGQLRGSGR